MAEDSYTVGLGGELAKPLHLQHLERSLDVEPFLAYVEEIFNTPIRYIKVKGADMLRTDVQILYVGPNEVSVIIKITVSNVFSLLQNVTTRILKNK
jgi:hypothetical protein